MSFVEQTGPASWRVRYWNDQGIHGTVSGFTTRADAQDKADEIDIARRRGTFQDPGAGRIAFADWADHWLVWLESCELAPATLAQYRALTRVHLITRWGPTALNDISGMHVQQWANGLRRSGYAHTTVATIVKIMSMMLADAVSERLIPENPIKPRRRGRHTRTHRPDVAWARPDQALRIALQAARVVGGWAAVLIVTAAWTGARWGELAGLQRTNLHLSSDATGGHIYIDPDRGALHEVEGQLFLGPPKTAQSERSIALPPFLAQMLTRHLQTHDAEHVFVTRRGHLLRRSNFARQALRPATRGTTHQVRPRHRLEPIVPGLTFHGFRHSHKTWMIEDGLPDVVQARRLGHTLPNRIDDIYSHVAPALEARLLTHLQTRFEDAVATIRTQPPIVTGAIPRLGHDPHRAHARFPSSVLDQAG